MGAPICEAVGRPNMRFVPVKSAEQLAVQAVHRIRSRLVADRRQARQSDPRFPPEAWRIVAKTSAVSGGLWRGSSATLTTALSMT
jgi:hypothetical protein